MFIGLGTVSREKTVTSATANIPVSLVNHAHPTSIRSIGIRPRATAKFHLSRNSHARPSPATYHLPQSPTLSFRRASDPERPQHSQLSSTRTLTKKHQVPERQQHQNCAEPTTHSGEYQVQRDRNTQLSDAGQASSQERPQHPNSAEPNTRCSQSITSLRGPQHGQLKRQ